MPSSKKLSQLIPDLRSGLQLSLEMAARDTTMKLKEIGPYWSGDFEAAWVVELGQTLIESDRPEEIPEGGIRTSAEPRKVTPVNIPLDDTDALRGYTIGNKMEYADQAMDLVPGTDDVYRGDRERATAPKDWFENYLLGGQAQYVIAGSLKKGMGLAGFDR
jgi:hypothetical protein